MSLIHCAQSYYYVIHYSSSQKERNTSSGDSQEDESRVQEDESFSRGENYFLRAIQSMPTNEIPYLLYARYLEENRLLDKAEKIHIQGLELNPFSVHNLRGYSSLLKKIGEVEMSERFEKRARMVETATKISVSDVSESRQYLSSFLT